jgi:hypothetical protein
MRNRTILRLAVGICVTLSAAPLLYARGFGGAHGGYSAGGYHGAGYSGGGYHEGGAYAKGPEGAGAARGGASGEVYHGPHGATVAHGTAGVQGAAVGSDGAAAGGKAASGTAVKGPEGNEYAHETSAGRGGAAGSEGAAAGRYASTGGIDRGAGGATYAHATAGYGTAHAALPTDAGYGGSAAGAGAAAHAAYHQTEAVSGGVYAARGAAVRTSWSGSGMFGGGWYAAHPGAWNPTGWAAGRAWGAATWPSVGAWCGFDGAPPVDYDYGNTIRYQGDQVYDGDQPIATADQYYQQASALAESRPAPDADAAEWTPLGVFGLVKGAESDPHYVMQLAVHKSGAVAGNYCDVLSGASVPVRGAVDKRTQRVAWTVGDNKTTVGETGIYNLTKEQSPALIHLGKDKTQQWTLVRLEPPETQDKHE